MTPIINPWIFYLIDVLSNLDLILAVGAVLAIAIVAVTFAQETNINNWETNHAAQIAECALWRKYAAIISIILSILTVLVPSQYVMTQILVANIVTYENVESVADIIQESVDYIFEKLE